MNWISTKDKLPPEDVAILCITRKWGHHNPTSQMPVTEELLYRIGDDWFDCRAGKKIYPDYIDGWEVTHWMEVPDSPWDDITQYENYNPKLIWRV